MNYISVADLAKKWDVSERTIRNYCSSGKIPGAIKIKKSWQIPENTKKPSRKNKKNSKPISLLEVLKFEKNKKIKGGIYHRIQIDLTYNSNHIEGSRLTHEQTRYIYETNTIGLGSGVINVDDIVETVNHFKCINMIIESAQKSLNENFIKKLHQTLKSGTTDSRKDWFVVGDYKKFPNEVGGNETTPPDKVHQEIKKLLQEYNKKENKSFDDLLDFHFKFERIHPFQDGNGRIGRLILFKECLKNNIVPFIINEDLKEYYYRGLQYWKNEKGFLRDTCLTAQDRFKTHLDYFRIPYN